jgi:ABC-type Fe3+/spermidine/putrescine transport system ATPase subunit
MNTAGLAAGLSNGLANGLTVQHITRRFGGQMALDDVSFEVHRGELVALVGASGSGKTTSLRIVAGYDTPDAGQVLFGGKDMTRVPPEKRDFGMVFQHYALFPHMSVLDNVAFGLEARGVSKAERLRRAKLALDGVGLQGKGDRRIQQLSGGEQQRVALARAMLIEPKVLLLDEPLSNLDPALRHSTRDELRAMLRRVGAPALFVTHDQEDAFAVADRIVLLANGRVLQIGTPQELYARPASREVAAFIGKATLVPAQDHGSSATVTLDGVTRSLEVTRPLGEDQVLSKALVVLRPEALLLSGPDSSDAWPGVITGRRFAGATVVYQVQLSDVVTVEVQSTRHLSEGERVGITVAAIPVPIVAV